MLLRDNCNIVKLQFSLQPFVAGKSKHGAEKPSAEIYSGIREGFRQEEPELARSEREASALHALSQNGLNLFSRSCLHTCLSFAVVPPQEKLGVDQVRNSGVIAR